MAAHVTFHDEVAPQAVIHSGFQRALHHGRQVIYTLSTVALILAAAIMSGGIIIRHVAGIALIWQDEVCVFLLVGATFLSAASVQARRGHVGIEAIAGFLSSGMNRVRLLISDLLSFLFCAFFTWKAAELLHEAWIEGQTSASPWGPPLWIPYSLMSLGMFFLTCQLLLQFIGGLKAHSVEENAPSGNSIEHISPQDRPKGRRRERVFTFLSRATSAPIRKQRAHLVGDQAKGQLAGERYDQWGNADAEDFESDEGGGALNADILDRRVNPKAPAPIRLGLREAETCFERGAFTAAIVMCWLVLQKACAAHGLRKEALPRSFNILNDWGIIDALLLEQSQPVLSLIAKSLSDAEASRSDAYDVLNFTQAVTDALFP
jgi:TRAP-type C4-dicarboxylate transport system permease small subunit